MKLPESLNLHVKSRLSVEDAARQRHTAQVILDRLEAQPGVILGDEVGMGKTFVALAVAASYLVENPCRPVVVMAPGNVAAKWERDAKTFVSACLESYEDRRSIRIRTVENGLEFLKALSSNKREHPTLLILAHGALNRSMEDSWTRLALLQAAIRGRHGVEGLRERLARFGPDILLLKTKVAKDLFLRLLRAPVNEWKALLIDADILADTDDDPVPVLFSNAMGDLDLEKIYREVVEVLPERDSKHRRKRLKQARDNLNDVLPSGKRVLQKVRLSLPLLILDEAHHVRNGHVQLAQLLKEQAEDLEDAGGALAHRFDRMLFLTATPFQLGHHELCNVLSRFESIAWKGVNPPAMSRGEFVAAITNLRKSLNDMQVCTARLEKAWKRLLPQDFDEAGRAVARWWERSEISNGQHNERLRRVRDTFSEARHAIREAEGYLRKWVIRHSKSRYLPDHPEVERRCRFEGAAVLREFGPTPASGGLRVDAENALPFLLAARLAAHIEAKDCGRVFGEGLASSYDALLNTHKEEASATHEAEPSGGEGRLGFHEIQLRDMVERLDARAKRLHPKIRATIDLAMNLWRKGEKVLIFCHYQQTGQALHHFLSDAMLEEIRLTATRKLDCEPGHVEAEMSRFVDRLDKDRAGEILKQIDELLKNYDALTESEATKDVIKDVVLRFMRTPTFLVRYADLDMRESPTEWMQSMLDKRHDASEMTLRKVLTNFFEFLSVRCGREERSDYLDALKKIQTGTHAGQEVNDSFDTDDLQVDRARLVANVRRVYGKTKDETRKRIMLTFNTPFYPEILISSSVMGEGVDLHLNCRHVIHHDLDWNPSSLEQRTGRIDRLGSKAEASGKPIHVYLPYVEGCQDEKLFRVVMDRERWFGVVMGAEAAMERVLSASTWESERLAEQPLVPEDLVTDLHLRLEPK